MEDRDRVVAVALLTQRDLDKWGAGLRSVYPLQTDSEFDDLLKAIDDAIDARSRPKFRREG